SARPLARRGVQAEKERTRRSTQNPNEDLRRGHAGILDDHDQLQRKHDRRQRRQFPLMFVPFSPEQAAPDGSHWMISLMVKSPFASRKDAISRGERGRFL